MTEPRKTLDDLANEIEVEAMKGDDRKLATAMLVRDLRMRIEAGEAGAGVKWTQWACQRFRRSVGWLAELNAIANAKDPKAAIARYRRANLERQKRRNDQLVERNPERRAVIKLMRSMAPDRVSKLHQYALRLTGA